MGTDCAPSLVITKLFLAILLDILMTYSCTLNNPTFEEEITNIYPPQLVLKKQQKQRVDYRT